MKNNCIHVFWNILLGNMRWFDYVGNLMARFSINFFATDFNEDWFLRRVWGDKVIFYFNHYATFAPIHGNLDILLRFKGWSTPRVYLNTLNFTKKNPKVHSAHYILLLKLSSNYFIEPDFRSRTYDLDNYILLHKCQKHSYLLPFMT